ASAEEGIADPSMRLINGYSGVYDNATFNDDGEVVLDVRATPGYGTRSLMSNLEGYGLVDVKEFTTTISLQSVPVGISAVFSLQTVPTGTIGPGNGNGVHVMMRMDMENQLTLVVYNQDASNTVAVKQYLTLDESKDLSISFSYANAAIVVQDNDEKWEVKNDIVGLMDQHYAENNYLGYWCMSSYYMNTAPTTENCQFIIREINGATPLALHTAAVEDAVADLEEGFAGLSIDSTVEEVNAVSALNVFKAGSSMSSILNVVNGSEALRTRIQTVEAGLLIYEQRVEFDAVDAQLNAFIAQLETYDKADSLSVKNTRDAYEAIDFDKMETLPAVYKDQLVAKFEDIKAMQSFSAFIVNEIELFFTQYEEMIDGEDVTSLSDYKAVASVPKMWAEFKQKNGLESLLEADALAEMEARAAAFDRIVSSSFYSRFWTEGDSWEAKLTEKGLYATGTGAYGETLGFNKKHVLGETTDITFNIIYALKTLGANHLHIGFYPVSNTGTLGNTDGVRIDFWFSAAGTIEIKPVNGATETEIFTGGWLSVEDTGYFDVETADYSVAQYKVELDEVDGVLVFRVNGLEMEIDGLKPDLFADGCYMTVSAMSVPGADPNEIMITNVGGVSYINYDPESENQPATPPAGDNPPTKKGCGSVVDFGGIITGMTILGAAMFARKRRESQK
ncbi:MAG: hypothetical protein J6K86_00550, partial [Clostridia bacterium]|nr:hypothetical protein [Clostridia bacterium]